MTSIWDYTIEKWGIEQAERYVRMLDRAFAELGSNSALEQESDFIRQGYRKHRVGQHVVFYPFFIALILLVMSLLNK